MRITFCMCFEVMSASFDCAGFPKKKESIITQPNRYLCFPEWNRERMGPHLCTSRGVIVNTREQAVEVVLNQSIYMLRDGHQGAPIAHDETCRSV